ncbi:hypothetical protein [Clostridium ihumii]|uniref:hypothetical protein n=1 Tax=Clostridium ihumii TaxID=1470356 RepID=UPI003D349188
MSIKKIFNSSIFSEICRGLIYIFIYVFVNKVSYSDSNVYQKKLEIISIIITAILSAIVMIIYRVFKRPLFIKVNILSLIGEKKEISISHFGKIGEKERTIRIKVLANNGTSIWNRVALYLLKKYSIKLVLQIKPKNNKNVSSINLIPYNPNIDLEKNLYGDLSIDITNALKDSLLDNREYNNEYKFIIKENRDSKPNHTQDFVIKPKVLINERHLDEGKLVWKVLINYKTNLNNDCFAIQYYEE